MLLMIFKQMSIHQNCNFAELTFAILTVALHFFDRKEMDKRNSPPGISFAQ